MPDIEQIGIRHDNAQIEEYEQAIKDGKILMRVDIDKERLETIENTARQHDPDAEIADTDPHKPAFP